MLSSLMSWSKLYIWLVQTQERKTGIGKGVTGRLKERGKKRYFVVAGAGSSVGGRVPIRQPSPVWGLESHRPGPQHPCRALMHQCPLGASGLSTAGKWEATSGKFGVPASGLTAFISRRQIHSNTWWNIIHKSPLKPIIAIAVVAIGEY